MDLVIDDKALPRVIAAIERRNQLLRMWTKDMPRDFEEQLNETHRIISAAVTVAIRNGRRS
ncbi:MAG: hypothetical protein HRT77_15605 [Halioglobus sp.]|nr:hypothetical protein [Halioglobus sp.]